RFAFLGVMTVAATAGCYGEGRETSQSTYKPGVGPSSNNNTIKTNSPDASLDASGGSPIDVSVNIPPPPILDSGPAPPPAVVCNPLRSSEPLVARSNVTSTNAVTGDHPVQVLELFSKFRTYCGACHVEQALGGFKDTKVTPDNFADLVDSVAVDRMRSNDPD